MPSRTPPLASSINWHQAFLHANWGILVLDGNREIEEANPAFANMHGYRQDEVKGRPFLELTAPQALAEAYGHWVLGEVRDNYRFDSLHRHKDGHVFPVQIDITNIRDEEASQCCVVSIRDISERREFEIALERTQKKLRSLSAHQEHLLEEERKHIAREIHDELGQKLFAIQLGLSNLSLRYGADPELRAGVEELRELLDDTIGVVRHVASNLRPAALDLGLVFAIDWLAEDFSHRWEIPCRVDTGDSEIALDADVATTVFRVAQESLTNVVRHAGASKVDISLQCDKHALHLLVSDDGRGFDPAVVREKRGLGLLGMRERVIALGGKLHIDSVLDKGTTVTINLPLATSMKT